MSRAELVAEVARLRAAVEQLGGLAILDVRRDAERELALAERDQLIETQRQLEEARDQYRDLFNFAPVGYVTTDRHGIIRAVNAAASQLLGSGRVLAGTPFADLVREEDRGAYFRHMREAAGGQVGVADDVALGSGDEAVLARLVTVRSGHGPGAGERFHTAILDVTDKVRAQAALRERVEMFHTLGEAVPDFLWMCDETLRPVYQNPSWARYTGLTGAELAEAGLESVFDPEDVPGLNERWEGARERGGEAFEFEARVRRHDGAYRWFLGRAASLRAPDGRLTRWVGTLTDIHDRKRAEEELARYRDHLETQVAERTRELELSHQRLRLSERMAALGTLVAGIGHDMANLLLPIRIALDQLATAPAPEVREQTRTIRECTDYIERLCRGLRLFALDPDHSEAEQRSHLAEWWSHTERFMRSALPPHVVLENAFPARIPPVRIGRAALTQAVFNLVQNAADVLRGRPAGRVRVSGESGELGDGAAVRVIVADDGPGMSPEVQRHCLEPFFTTKTRGLSTGLGLSLVHGIVEKAGGRVEIETAPERGTRVVLVLPAAVEPAEQASHQRTALLSLGDERLQSFARSVLTALGFHVSERGRVDELKPTLWLTDQANGRDIRQAIETHLAEWVMLLGHDPDAAGIAHLIELGSSPRPTLLQEKLREVAHSAGPALGDRTRL